MNQTLTDYREILAGMQKDLDALERSYADAVAEAANLYERLILERSCVDKFKSEVQQLEAQ